MLIKLEMQTEDLSLIFALLQESLKFWNNEKQKAMARSSVEAYYRYMATETAYVTWIQHLLRDIRQMIKSQC